MEYKVEVTEPIETTLKTDENKPHRVCAYCRVSTDETDQKNSLKAQKEFFERYFKTHPHWTNVGIFADEGLSGTSLEKRDAFNRMIFEAKRGNVDFILTKEVSRFSRNVRDIMQIVEDLENIGVYVWFLSDDINTERVEDRSKLTNLANIAEQESIRTSNRVRWGHQQRMQQGVVFGRKEMYGYNIVKDDFGIQHFEIIPEEAEVIKNIFEWFASGEGTHRIARRLEQQGITTKRYKNGWSTTVILRILRNEKYVGDLIQGKTYTPKPLKHKKKYNHGESRKYTIRDHHKESAIISRELWDKVQKILEEKAPSEEIKAKHSNRYWTSGKIYCGLCGQRYVSYVKKQKNTPYRAWVCFENHQRGNYKQITLDTGVTTTVGCNALRVNDRVLKIAVHDIVTEYIIPHKETILAEMRKEIAELSKPQDHTRKIASLEKQIEQAQQKINKLTQGWMDGIVPENAYKMNIGTANAHYEELQAELRKLQAENNSASAEVEIYEEYIEQLQSILSLTDDELNDAFYERVTKQIFVYPLNLLEFRLSFIPMPIYMQYMTSGRGKDYKAEFTILSKEQFAELLEKAPKNEITETE
ncbi:MAG: recombinase family protein [Clostridia bacterium]|nr:recombinase family protein [Clostridia bacterium]